jgi:hypothetical protein
MTAATGIQKETQPKTRAVAEAETVVFTAKEKALLENLVAEVARLREELECWRETWEIQNDPKAMANIAEGKRDVAEGRVCSWEEFVEEFGLDEK